jgi:hypothetical protein
MTHWLDLSRIIFRDISADPNIQVRSETRNTKRNKKESTPPRFIAPGQYRALEYYRRSVTTIRVPCGPVLSRLRKMDHCPLSLSVAKRRGTLSIVG